MNPRIEFYNRAFSERNNGFDVPVLREIPMYQYNQSLGDVLRSIVRFIPRVAQFLKTVAMKGVQTFLKAGSELLKRVPRSKT